MASSCDAFSEDSFASLSKELAALLAEDIDFPVLPPLPTVETKVVIADVGPVSATTVPARASKKRARPTRGTSGGESSGSVAERSSSRGEADEEKKAPRPTRWRKDQSKLGSLEQQAEEQQAMAEEVERENRRLRLRTAAMEHVLAARERQLAILSKYHHLCGPGSSTQPSREALELQEAANISLSALVRHMQHTGIEICTVLYCNCYPAFNAWSQESCMETNMSIKHVLKLTNCPQWPSGLESTQLCQPNLRASGTNF